MRNYSCSYGKHTAKICNKCERSEALSIYANGEISLSKAIRNSTRKRKRLIRRYKDALVTRRTPMRSLAPLHAIQIDTAKRTLMIAADCTMPLVVRMRQLTAVALTQLKLIRSSCLSSNEAEIAGKPAFSYSSPYLTAKSHEWGICQRNRKHCLLH